MAWWISLVSVSRNCWPGLTSDSGSRAGIAACAANAASSAFSAVWTSVLMNHPGFRYFCGGSSTVRAPLINSSRCCGSVGEGSKSKCA